MEALRRRTEDFYRKKLMSTNDHVRNWYFRWKNMKESILPYYEDDLLEKEKKRRPSVKEIENVQPRHEKEKQRTANNHKHSKKDQIYLELKAFKRQKKPLNQTGSIDNQKAARRLRKKESALAKQHEHSVVERTLPCLSSTWEHTNFSVVPTFNVNRAKKYRDTRSKKSHRVDKPAKIQPEVADLKQTGDLVWKGQKNKKVEVFCEEFNNFMKNRPNVANDSGEAVVIYQRQKRSKYYHPPTGDGYQFEQISFTGSCEETIDFVQSKRSLSEPLQNSKEVYVTRRRTRFFLEPQKRIPTQSDFHSAIDFFQRGGSLEFKQFGSSVTKFIYKNPLAEEKNPFGEIGGVHQEMMLRKSKPNSKLSTGFRLRQTAEKKLDLHREMIRVENVSQKKFWESIEKSLNYRCAVAQMFSSQSFLTTNESSNMITSTEDSARSTNIFMRKGFVEKISSYQGFSTIITSTKTGTIKKAKPGNVQQLSFSTMQQIKAVLDSILLKEGGEEEEEEEIFLKQKFDRNLNYRSNSESTVQTDISVYDTVDCFLTDSTSKKLSEMESNLWSTGTNHKLESLMSKLSEEIRKYSDFIKQFNDTTKEKLLLCNLARPSMSDSRLEICKSGENRLNRKNSIFNGWPTINQQQQKAVYPLFIYPKSHPQPVNVYKVDHIKHEKAHRHRKKRKEDEKVVKIRDSKHHHTHHRPHHTHHPHHTGTPIGSNDTLFPFDDCTPILAPPPPPPPPPPPTPKEFPCCDDCRLLKKRIIKLEEDLEKVQKIMPFCPKEHQDSIKSCLESLNLTSGAFLRKLKSYTKMRYLEDCQKDAKKGSKRSTSTPGPIVHDCQRKKLNLCPNSSDCRMNVAMGITMENVDPVTGEKLCSDVCWENRQEGNIQCTMYRDNEDPVMVMDTNFSYNPQTGMLFSKNKSNTQCRHTIEEPNVCSIVGPTSNINIPKGFPTDSTYDCLVMPQKSEFANLQRTLKRSKRNLTEPESPVPLETKERIQLAEEDLLLKKLKSRENEKISKRKDTSTQVVSGKSRESLESCLSETGLDSEESKKYSKVSFGKTQNDRTDNVSRIPVRRKATASCTNSKVDSMSQKSSMTSFLVNPMFPERFLSNFQKHKKPPKSLEKSEELEKLEEVENAEKGKKLKKKLDKKSNFTSKSLQAFESTEALNSDSGKKCEVKDFGVQVSTSKRSVETQTYMEACEDLTALESVFESPSCTGTSTKSACLSELTYTAYRPDPLNTVNDEVQTDTLSEKRLPAVTVGIQTNLPTDEHLKYINDLQIQKKLAKLFSFTWTFGFFLCKLVHYMQSVSAICSVLTLTAMSLERYYAIVHPMKAQYICTISQARRIITATWISAFLLAVPILFAQVHLRVGVKVEAYWCVRDWDNKTIWRAHELYMMLLILVVPTVVMAVAYTAICCEIWEVIQRRQDMTSGKGHAFCRRPRLSRNSSTNSFPSCTYGNNTIRLDNKRRGRSLLKREPGDDGASVKQVIKMLVAVVVIYVICWGPMLIDNVLQAYGILSHIRMGRLKYMGTTFHLMAYFNSCINPIIYGFMSKNFRESFRKTLCCVGKKPKTAYRSFSLSQTRNTSIRYAESSFGRTISIALPV